MPAFNTASVHLDALKKYVVEKTSQAMRKEKIPGVSVAFIDDQDIVFSQGFGYSRIKPKTPATARTLYRVGSLSKLFTVAATLRLIDERKLQLDEPIRKWLPRFDPKSIGPEKIEITPRMLMTHHSGLPRDILKSMQNKNPGRFNRVGEEFNGYLNYEPGQVFSYSNLGMMVLGSLVEKLSGIQFEKALSNILLQPLQMEESSFSEKFVASSAMAGSYSGFREFPVTPFRDIPAGGMVSSAMDLANFVKMIFARGRWDGRQILSPEMLAELFRVQNEEIDLDFDTHVGLGFFLAGEEKSGIPRSGQYAWHGGAIDGYRSFLGLLPEHNLGVVVLSNSSTGREFAAKLSCEMLAMGVDIKTRGKHPVNRRAIAAASEPPEPADLVRQWVGSYTTEFGYIRIYSPDGRTLWVDAYGRKIRMRAREEGGFGLDYQVLGVIPINIGYLGRLRLLRRSVGGREVLVAVVEGCREALFGERIEPSPKQAETQALMSKIAGSYEVVNWAEGDRPVFGDVRVYEEDDFLIVKMKIFDLGARIRLAMKVVDAERALLLVPLADGGDVVEVIPEGEGRFGLSVSGLVLRKKNGFSPGSVLLNSKALILSCCRRLQGFAKLSI